MLKDFKKFAIQGNVIDLAIAVIIGTAFGKIISSLVTDIIMPIVNPFIPGGDRKNIVVGPGIKIGSFLGTVVDFLIITFFIFLLVKLIERLKSKDEVKPLSTQEKLLTEIRDLLKK